MLQIIGLLLCFYLVFKGLEIFQIGLSSARETRGSALALGVIALVAAMVIAGLFAMMLMGQGNAMPPGLR
jgi:uncharacterized membrane protein